MLSVLPSEMTRGLATLSTTRVASVAKDWAIFFREDASSIKSDFVRKFELARPDSEWINRLRELSTLAREAVASGKDIFVWITA